MATRKPKELPSVERNEKGLPNVGNPENTVLIGEKPYEIKPTKLKYQRDKTAYLYKALDMFPQPEILAWDERQLGDGIDGDKALMDWLIAVTDDEQLIIENYDDMDSETIYRLLAVFKRINYIDEKEEKLKNAQRMTKEVE